MLRRWRSSPGGSKGKAETPSVASSGHIERIDSRPSLQARSSSDGSADFARMPSMLAGGGVSPTRTASIPPLKPSSRQNPRGHGIVQTEHGEQRTSPQSQQKPPPSAGEGASLPPLSPHADEPSVRASPSKSSSLTPHAVPASPGPLLLQRARDLSASAEASRSGSNTLMGANHLHSRGHTPETKAVSGDAMAQAPTPLTGPGLVVPITSSHAAAAHPPPSGRPPLALGQTPPAKSPLQSQSPLPPPRETLSADATSLRKGSDGRRASSQASTDRGDSYSTPARSPTQDSTPGALCGVLPLSAVEVSDRKLGNPHGKASDEASASVSSATQRGSFFSRHGSKKKRKDAKQSLAVDGTGSPVVVSDDASTSAASPRPLGSAEKKRSRKNSLRLLRDSANSNSVDGLAARPEQNGVGVSASTDSIMQGLASRDDDSDLLVSASMLRVGSSRGRSAGGTGSRRGSIHRRLGTAQSPSHRVAVGEAALSNASFSLDDVRPVSRHPSSLSRQQQAALQRTPSFLSRHHTPPPNFLRPEGSRSRHRRRAPQATALDDAGASDDDATHSSVGAAAVIVGREADILSISEPSVASSNPTVATAPASEHPSAGVPVAAALPPSPPNRRTPQKDATPVKGASRSHPEDAQDVASFVPLGSAISPSNPPPPQSTSPSAQSTSHAHPPAERPGGGGPSPRSVAPVRESMSQSSQPSEQPSTVSGSSSPSQKAASPDAAGGLRAREYTNPLLKASDSRAPSLGARTTASAESLQAGPTPTREAIKASDSVDRNAGPGSTPSAAPYLSYAAKVVQTRRASGDSSSSASVSPLRSGTGRPPVAAPSAGPQPWPMPPSPGTLRPVTTSVSSSKTPPRSKPEAAAVENAPMLALDTEPSPARPALPSTGSPVSAHASAAARESPATNSVSDRRQRQLRMVQAYYDDDEDLFGAPLLGSSYTPPSVVSPLSAAPPAAAQPRAVKKDLATSPSSATGGATAAALVPEQSHFLDDDEDSSTSYDSELLVGFRPDGFDAKRGARRGSSITMFILPDDSFSSTDTVLDEEALKHIPNAPVVPLSSTGSSSPAAAASGALMGDMQSYSLLWDDALGVRVSLPSSHMRRGRKSPSDGAPAGRTPPTLTGTSYTSAGVGDSMARTGSSGLSPSASPPPPPPSKPRPRVTFVAYAPPSNSALLLRPSRAAAGRTTSGAAPARPPVDAPRSSLPPSLAKAVSSPAKSGDPQSDPYDFDLVLGDRVGGPLSPLMGGSRSSAHDFMRPSPFTANLLGLSDDGIAVEPSECGSFAFTDAGFGSLVGRSSVFSMHRAAAAPSFSVPLLPQPPGPGILVCGVSSAVAHSSSSAVAATSSSTTPRVVSKYAADPAKMHCPISNTFGRRGRRGRQTGAYGDDDDEDEEDDDEEDEEWEWDDEDEEEEDEEDEEEPATGSANVQLPLHKLSGSMGVLAPSASPRSVQSVRMSQPPQPQGARKGAAAGLAEDADEALMAPVATQGRVTVARRRPTAPPSPVSLDDYFTASSNATRA